MLFSWTSGLVWQCNITTFWQLCEACMRVTDTYVLHLPAGSQLEPAGTHMQNGLAAQHEVDHSIYRSSCYSCHDYHDHDYHDQ